jgi:3-vinyl bacteriochlorophyllide hydratase
MIAQDSIFRWIDALDACPFGAIAGRTHPHGESLQTSVLRQGSFVLRREKRLLPLYSSEQRERRDRSPWTMVQGVLAPAQFLVFLVSLGLVLRFVLTGEGLGAATWSVVVKTGALYAIMITGAIWENAVFGRYLFARAFFWEDAFSLLVLALHTLYLAALFGGLLAPHGLMLLALAAYAAYLINATQFVLKLRTARLEAGLAG